MVEFPAKDTVSKKDRFGRALGRKRPSRTTPQSPVTLEPDPKHPGRTLDIGLFLWSKAGHTIQGIHADAGSNNLRRVVLG